MVKPSNRAARDRAAELGFRTTDAPLPCSTVAFVCQSRDDNPSSESLKPPYIFTFATISKDSPLAGEYVPEATQICRGSVSLQPGLPPSYCSRAQFSASASWGMAFAQLLPLPV